jgi:hypothetical protein
VGAGQLLLDERTDPLGDLHGLGRDDSREEHEGRDDYHEDENQRGDRRQRLPAPKPLRDSPVQRPHQARGDRGEEHRHEEAPNHQQEEQRDPEHENQQKPAPNSLRLDPRVHDQAPFRVGRDDAAESL